MDGIQDIVVGGHCVIGKNAQTGDAIGHKNDSSQFQQRISALNATR